MKKNLAVIFMANSFTLLSGVVTSLLAAWALGPEGRGDLAVVVLYPNIVALAVGLGMPQATRFFVARDPRKLSLLFSNAVCFAVVMGLVGYFAAELVVPHLVKSKSEAVMWLLRAYLINIPFALMYDLMAGMLEGARQFRWAAVSRVLFFSIQAGGYLVLWLTGHLTVYSAAATMVAAQLANTATALTCVLLVLRPAWRPSLRAFKRTVQFGFKYHVGVVTSFTTLRLDQMMLGGMATSIEMGLYVVAVRLSEVMTVLASSVSEVLMPEVASSNGSERSIRVLAQSLRRTMYVYLLLLVPICLSAPYVLEYGFGSGFVGATPALRLLLVGSMVWSAGSIINSGLNGLGSPGLSTISRLTSAVVTVLTLLVWLPRYGILGAALSSLVGYSAMFGVALFWLVRKEKLRLSDVLLPRRDDIAMKHVVSILRRSSGDGKPINGNDRELFVEELFENQAHSAPDSIAVVSKDGEITYGELNRKANQLARFLKSRGVGPETLVPISVGRSTDMAIGILGILKAGAAFVPIDPAYPQERVEFMLADIKAPFILTQSELLSSCGVERICLDDRDAIGDLSTEGLAVEAGPDNLAYVIYTSGSTGKPKGVMLTRGNLSHYVHALQAEFSLSASDVYLHLASIGFSSSRRHLLLPLAFGGTVVIADEYQRLDPVPLFRLVKERRVTVFDAVPSFQRHCLNALVSLDAASREALLNNDLRLIISASEPLYSDIPKTWMVDFHHPAEHIHMIGQTETSGIISLNRVTQDDISGALRTVPVGKAIARTEIVLLDDDQKPVADGERGEIYVSGAGLGRGYFGRDELTAEKFVELSLHGRPPGKYCRTGDHARILPDGRLECLGRSDFQIKVRGNRIELSEIEALLLGHELVRECVVLGREDGHGEILLTAYVVAIGDEAVITNDLRDIAVASLPDYMHPSAFVFLDSLPLTPNGKIDRKALPAPRGYSREEALAGEAISSAETIEEIWCEILGVPTIRPHDNFFSLGGHSLTAARMISRVRKSTGVEIPLRTIFDSPTFESFKQSVEVSVKTGAKALSRVFPPRPERIPLSFAQQRVWFLGELDRGLTAYNECEILKLRGELDDKALRNSLEQIVRRHEILRTCFRTDGGEPSQVVLDEASFDLDMVDLTAHADGRDAALRIARQLADKAFDLSKSPLFRVTLAQTAPDEHYLIFVLHHAVTDQWTVGVLIRELDAFYSAAADNRPLALRPLSIQYADYAAWQQNWLKTEDYRNQLSYWRAQLAGAPSLLDLPTDHARPPAQRYEGAQATTFLNGDSRDEIRSFCEREGVTLFMLLLATWELLLYRYSGQDQVVIGTPIAGRSCPETEDLIGFFVNTLALRADLSGNPSFRELLQRTKERALGAYANQDLPFEKLVEEINPERNLSYTPIFQVMFTLQNTPAFADGMGELSVERLRLKKESAKFDLSLDAFERPTGFELQLEFNTDLFEPQTAERMLSHLRVLLKSLIKDPSQRLSSVQLMPEHELTQILKEWNSETVDVPAACLHELIEAQTDRQPDAVAVVWKDEILSYRQLDVKANQLANYLRASGVGPDEIVGVHMDKSIDLIVAVVAIMKAGGAYLPLDPNYPTDRLQYAVSEAEVRVLITREEFTSSAADLACETVIFTDGNADTINGESTLRPASGVEPHNLVYVTFTSGSTGRAKGVMIEHRSVVNAFAAWEKAYQLPSVNSHLQMASFSFDVFAGDLTRALCSGAKLVLCPTETLLEPAHLESMIREHNIEAAEFVPAVIRPLMDHLEETGRTLDTFKLAIVGSDTWQIDEYRRLQSFCMPGARVVNSYGVTEATIDSTYFESSTDETGASAEIVPIGRPFPNTQIYVLDHLQQPVPVGVPGELYQGGNGLARGYLNRPDLTAEKFVEVQLPLADGNAVKRLYRTGDLAKYKADGTIAIIGRADNQVKLRGYRIELGEIESVLSRHPDVNECVVVLREDVPGDKRLAAYLTSRSGELKSSELRNFLKAALPEYMVPATYVQVGDWKLTPNGKIDRKQLPVPESSSASGDTLYTAPSNEIEQLLADIWALLLRVERVGVDDNFFDLGGHSLLATQAISRTRDALGCDIPLRVMFETPTVAEIARGLEGKIGSVIDMAPSRLGDDAEIERLLAELEGVTDEQASEFLAGLDEQYSPARIGSK